MTHPSSLSSPRWVAVRLASFYGALFLVVGIIMPFWPIWLRSRGLEDSQIGIVFAVAMLTRTLATPIATHIADVRGDRHVTMRFLAAGAVGVYLLYGLTWNFWTVLPVAVLAACFLSPLMPLVENLTVRAAYDHKLDYGRIRLWGSVTFVLTAVVGGSVLKGAPADLIWLMIVGAVVLTFGATLTLPADQQPKIAKGEGSRIWSRMHQLVLQKNFVLFIAVCGLIQASHAVYYAFGTLHWLSVGYSETTIGLLWAEGVVAEIALFAVSNRIIRRMGPERLLLLACVLGVVRWLVTGLTGSLWVLFVVQLLHAMTYGAAHLAAMHFIQRTTPPDLSATAQSVYSATAMGIMMGAAMFAAGPLYDTLKGGAYIWMAAMAVLATLGAIKLTRAH